jgi:DNA repair protein RadC
MDNTPKMLTGMQHMPDEDRPRERLARLGAEALRDAELLAVLFRTGTREMGAVALADTLLRHFDDLRGLARASVEQIVEVKGIGHVKAIEIKAALELGKRLSSHKQMARPRITCKEDVSAILMTTFREYETEHFKALLLNTKNEVLKVVDVSKGTVDGTLASPRDVFRQAVRENATFVIVAHNHPSGDPEPSSQDIALTEELAKAGDLLNVKLLDHVIFGDGKVISLKERHYL